MRKFLMRAALTGLMVVCGAFFGCEGSPDTDNVDGYFDGTSMDGADDRPGTTAAQVTMAISPGSTTLTNNGDVAAFSVEGASGAVNWSVQDVSKGSILTQSSASSTYQRSAAGGNVVIATDSRGNAAFSTVSQP